jgi:hypothetical protein
MDKYYVQVDDSEGVYLLADNWECSIQHLKFYQNKKMIAMFTSYKYWIIADEDTEIRSP